MTDKHAKERARRVEREIPGSHAELCWERGGDGTDAFLRVYQGSAVIGFVTEDGSWDGPDSASNYPEGTAAPLISRKMGRPPFPEEKRRQLRQVFLLPATIATLEAQAQPGEGLGPVIDRLIGGL